MGCTSFTYGPRPGAGGGPEPSQLADFRPLQVDAQGRHKVGSAFAPSPLARAQAGDRSESTQSPAARSMPLAALDRRQAASSGPAPRDRSGRAALPWGKNVFLLGIPVMGGQRDRWRSPTTPPGDGRSPVSSMHGEAVPEPGRATISYSTPFLYRALGRRAGFRRRVPGSIIQRRRCAPISVRGKRQLTTEPSQSRSAAAPMGKVYLVGAGPGAADLSRCARGG